MKSPYSFDILFVCLLGSSLTTSCPGEIVPWTLIAEEYCQKTLDNRVPPGNRKTLRDFDPFSVYEPQKAAVITYAPEYYSDEHEIKISRWTGTAWKLSDQSVIRKQNSRLALPKGIAEEGFYKIQVTQDPQLSPNVDNSIFVLISHSWKRNLFAFCRKNRDLIETNPDSQLIRSCLAVAHWDHLMENLSVSKTLTGHLLALLNNAIQAQTAFNNNQCPDLVFGLNKLRLRRYPGDQIEEFVLCIPEHYDTSRSWPLFVHTDNNRWATRDNYRYRSGVIDLWWHTAANKNVDWKSYSTLRTLLADKLNIDDDRIHINGDCSNGLAAMSLALNYPDHWASCSISLVSTYRYMSANAINLPLVFVKDNYHTDKNSLAYYHFALKCFQFVGCEHLQFNSNSQTIR